MLRTPEHPVDGGQTGEVFRRLRLHLLYSQVRVPNSPAAAMEALDTDQTTTAGRCHELEEAADAGGAGDAREPPSAGAARGALRVAVLLLPWGAWALVCALALGRPAGAAAVPPYLALQLATVAAARALRDARPALRWAAGVAAAAALSVFKTAALLPQSLGPGAGLGPRAAVFATTALWECSNAALVVGGAALQQRFGVTGYGRALVYGLAPCQLRFVEARRPGLAARRSLHLAGGLACGLGLRELLRLPGPGLARALEAVPPLEAEALALLLSALVLALDLPAHAWQLLMDALGRLAPGDPDLRVEVVLPFGAVYCSASLRQFWGRWSRPAGQLIRQLVYHPLGGPARPWLSVPLLFALNGAAHFDVGQALVGDRRERWWMATFLTLGLAATVEVVATDRLRARGEGALPRWFRIARAVMAHAVLRVALYLFLRGCLMLRLSDLL